MTIANNPLATLPLSASAQVDVGPIVVNRAPLGDGQSRVAHISFDLMQRGAAINLASVEITVNGVTVYQSETAISGYTVTRTAVSGGYTYDVARVVAWSPGVTVTVTVDATDAATVVMPTETWSFAASSAGSSVCAPGLPLALENRMRLSYAAPNLEAVRRAIGWVVSNDTMEMHRLRGVTLIALENDFAAVLNDVLTLPATLRRETVCQRRRLFEMVHALHQIDRYVPGALNELSLLGMGPAYRTLLQARLNGPSPAHRISAVCVMVVLAAVLYGFDETP